MQNDPILTPIFIYAGFGGTAFTIGATAVTYASILSSATLLAASVAVGFATQPGRPAASPPPAAGHQPVKQAIPARVGGYGVNRIGGVYMLYEASETDSFDVIALVSGRISGFLGFYLNDDAVNVTAEADTSVSPGVGTVYTVQTGGDGRYRTGVVRFYTRIGLSQNEAYPQIVANLPTLWTSDHRGDAITSMAMICSGVETEEHMNVYPNNLPKPSAVLNMYPIWDPRDPAQDPNNAATWASKSNPILHLIDYLTHPDHGMGLPRDRLIMPRIGALNEVAYKCDELVLKANGSYEPRYQCATWFNFDTDPAEVLSDILASCDGWMSLDGDGGLVVEVGAYVDDLGPPITEKHILGVSLDYGQPDEESINELTVAYTSPVHDYTTVAATPWRDETSIRLRGKTRSQPFSPKAVQSNSQARRLAKRFMARVNSPLRGTLTTTLFGLTKQGKRWIAIKYPFIAELADARVEVRRMQVDFMAGQCTFEWVLVFPDLIDAWNPAQEESVAPIRPPRLVEGGVTPFSNSLDFSKMQNSQYISLLEDI